MALVLIVAVLGISSGAIFVKWADGVPSLVIAFWRLAFAGAVVLLVAEIRCRFHAAPRHRLESRDRSRALLAAFLLAAHFALWITSLAYTSVASAVVLVATSPFFVALAGWLWFGKPLTKAMMGAMALAVAGSALIGARDLHLSSTALIGDAMALGGSMAIAGYWMVAADLRSRVGTLDLVRRVYPAGAVALGVLALLAGHSLIDYELSQFGILLGASVFPQIIGHTGLNYALRAASATLVALVSVSEPIGASLLAWLLLGESLGSLTVAGGSVLVVGVAWGVWSAAKESPQN